MMLNAMKPVCWLLREKKCKKNMTENIAEGRLLCHHGRPEEGIEGESLLGQFSYACKLTKRQEKKCKKT